MTSDAEALDALIGRAMAAVDCLIGDPDVPVTLTIGSHHLASLICGALYQMDACQREGAEQSAVNAAFLVALDSLP